jgi:hypothetical protein
MLACKERAKLVIDWRDAVMILAESIGQIQTCNLDRFEERYVASAVALEVAGNAHALLTLHREKHGC